ncbi:MAG: hypothetical protein V7637_350 [Mycobacteriales bacterium]
MRMRSRMALRWPAAARRTTVLSAAALLVTVASAGPASSAPAAAPPATTAAAATVDWTDCGGGLQCGTVAVPLDYRHPDADTISIALIRLPAADQANRIGSLFINPGGPGGSGVALVRQAGATLQQLYGNRFDVVGFDPRGVGASTSVRCFADATQQALFYANEERFPVGSFAERRFEAKLGLFTSACGARSGGLLPYLSTEFAARDLDRLRAAVGDERLTYLGLSYGTALGATYANLFPGRVRALVLDGVTDPTAYTGDVIDWLAGSLADTEKVLTGFAATCAAAGPARCALAGKGDVRQRIARLLAKLRQAPVQVPDAPGVPTLVSYQTTLGAIFSSLYSTVIWQPLAAALVALERGNGLPLLQLFSASAAPPSGDYDNTADAQAGILCTDGTSPRDPARWPGFVRRLSRISPTGGPVLGWLNALPCATWPARAVSRYTGPWNARTAHPVLLVGVTHDPITPLASARKLARLMGPSAVLLTHDGFGHSSFGQLSSCTLATAARYFATGALPAPGTVCTADEPLFPAPGSGPTATSASPAAAAGRRMPYPVTLPPGL